VLELLDLRLEQRDQRGQGGCPLVVVLAPVEADLVVMARGGRAGSGGGRACSGGGRLGRGQADELGVPAGELV